MSADGRTDETPTPFYDHLMSMVQATALENTRVPQHDDAGAQPFAHDRWRIFTLVSCTAGLIVAVVAGGGMLALGARQKEPPVVAAGAAPEVGSQLVGNATTAGQPAETSPVAAEPDSQEPSGVEGNRTAEGAVGAGSELAAGSDASPAASSVAEGSVEAPGPGPETRADVPAAAPSSTTAMGTDPTAAPAKAPDEPAGDPWSPELARAPVDQAPTPVASSIARVISDVKMRAGPGNAEAVLTTIPKGSSVEVVACRAWCEVIFTGQRGWVYKSFVGPSPSSDGR